MKPVVICYPTNLKNETEAITALFENGLEILHVRKPAFSEKEMQDWIESIDSKYHKQMTIHSHLTLVESMGLRGVHFTSYNRHLIDDYSFSASPKSISVHAMSELINLSDAFNYALLSPVFESITKEGYGPAISHEVLKEYLSRNHEVPVLALGGIESTNVVVAKELGFDGVVLHGHLWAEFEKDGDVNALIERFKEVTAKW